MLSTIDIIFRKNFVTFFTLPFS